jgi:hypothetical protein
LQVPVQGPFPPNAQAGIRWNVLALWLADDSDGSGQYYERCVLLAPDGTKKIEVHDEFVMERRYHRSNLTIFGFPIDQAGDYILTLELRQNEAEFTEVARFPITLSHIKSVSFAPS